MLQFPAFSYIMDAQVSGEIRKDKRESINNTGVKKMKERMHSLSVRLLALAASLMLTLVCVLTAGITAEAVVADPYVDVDFETYLAQQNFPESYKTELRKLHILYPYWKFEAQHTGLEWSEAVQAESKVGLNLVQNNQPTSWKSVQEGAYDWDKGEWVVFDSGNWVSASKEIISYYMDPRNFLDEKYVFQFLCHSYNPQEQTKEGLQSMVDGTFLAGTYEEGGAQEAYVDTLLKAAEESGVNPYTLASMIIIEQGSQGTGNGISGNVSGYEGYYNFFSVGAYKANGMTAVERGLWFAKGGDNNGTSYGRPWNTRTSSIIGGAQHYGSGYVEKGQDTLYLKKFNVQGANLYNHQYMGNVGGAALEASPMSNAYTGAARDANLTFKIPVYLNMPESACVKPTGNDTPVKDDDNQNTGGTPEAGDDSQNTGGTPEVDTDPKEPDGDIILGNTSGQVGDTVAVNTMMKTHSNVIASGKVVLSYNSNALKLVEDENVSGGAGSAVVSQTNLQQGDSVSVPVNFEILAEGTHNIKVESYETVTEGEEILTLTKGSGKVEATAAPAASTTQPEVSQPEESQTTADTPVSQISDGAASASAEPGRGTTQKTSRSASVTQGTDTSQEVSASRSGSAAQENASAVTEKSSDKPKISVTEKKKTEKDGDKKSEKKKNVDASKYDEEEKEEATMVSSVNNSLKKQLGIILACMAVAGICAGAFYFVKDIIKNRE